LITSPSCASAAEVGPEHVQMNPSLNGAPVAAAPVDVAAVVDVADPVEAADAVDVEAGAALDVEVDDFFLLLPHAASANTASTAHTAPTSILLTFTSSSPPSWLCGASPLARAIARHQATRA
jgi:hypothetical protein